MVGRGRREERCGAGQSLQQTPAPHPNKPVTGTELPCIVWHFGVRVHPALEKDGVRDRTPVQLQAVPSAGRSLPVVRPRTGLLLQGVQRAVEGREAARGAATLPGHGEGARDGPAPPASLPDPPGGTCARGGQGGGPGLPAAHFAAENRQPSPVPLQEAAHRVVGRSAVQKCHPGESGRGSTKSAPQGPGGCRCRP